MKRNFNRVIGVLLSLILAFCAVVPAFAENAAEAAKPELKLGESIELSVTSDKSSYSWGDTIAFTVEVKNITNQPFAALSVEMFAETDGFFFADDMDNTNTGNINPNETKKLECHFLSRKLSDFEKYFVAPFYSLKSFFNGLFNGYDEYILTTKVKINNFRYIFGIKAEYEDAPDYYTEDIEEIVAMYNKAYSATDPAPEGYLTMKLGGEVTADGSVGAVLSVLTPSLDKALANSSGSTNYIPGSGNILAEDVTAATAVSRKGVTTIYIRLNEQIDGANADSKSGPVGRGIGTLGNIQSTFESLGANADSGIDTVKLTYSDAYIKCTVDNSTGKITGGTWHYYVDFFVGDLALNINGLSASMKNLNAPIDFKVVI